MRFMKAATPTLLPLLRSRAQGDIMAWIMLRPETAHSLTEVANATNASVSTVMREVDRLVDAGLVRSERRGNLRQVQADTTTRLYRPLAEVLALTFGPAGVLTEALSTVPGIDEAFIYGSWAERFSGRPGAVPADVDVVVIGEPDRARLAQAVEDAERRLRREVNVRRIRRPSWDADQGSFKATVMARPRVHLVGGHAGDETGTTTTSGPA